MNRLVKLSVVAAAVVALSACTRIETGEVGVRVGFDKQVKPGDWRNGTMGWER
jgi:hypothetical protein